MAKTIFPLHEALNAMNSLITRLPPQLAMQLEVLWRRRTPEDLLLALEWMFLIGAILVNIFSPPPPFLFPDALPSTSGFPWLQVLTIIAFGLMGLNRPRQKWVNKVLYTTAEFGLIYLPIFINPRLSFIFPPLHLIILIRSCSMFGKFGQLLTAIWANSLFIVAMFFQKLDIQGVQAATNNTEQLLNIAMTMRLNAMMALVLISTFILLLTDALLSVQRSRQELALAHDRLRQYALQIEDQAILQERNRIAREMHDALGHTLTAQSLQLDTARYFWQTDAEKAVRSLNEAKQLTIQALSEVRQAISTLRADPLQGLPLDGAIGKLIQNFHQTTEILPSWTLRLTHMPPTNVSFCVYRVVQEALSNIARHSHATEVNIYLQTTAKHLNVVIQDNGIGFDPSQNSSGFGLQGMQERVLGLGGLLSIVSQPELGCKVMAQLPLTENTLEKSSQILMK
jgi:signal transduction histidine kinase